MLTKEKDNIFIFYLFTQVRILGGLRAYAWQLWAQDWDMSSTGCQFFRVHINSEMPVRLTAHL